jgi:hypothetical protein
LKRFLSIPEIALKSNGSLRTSQAWRKRNPNEPFKNPLRLSGRKGFLLCGTSMVHNINWRCFYKTRIPDTVEEIAEIPFDENLGCRAAILGDYHADRRSLYLSEPH